MARIEEVMDTNFAHNKARAIANIVHTAGWIRSRFETFIKPYGISMQQFNILRILNGADEWLNMHDLRKRMVEKSPNTTRLCDKLVHKELIDRRRGETDRRVVFLRISQEGRDLLARIDESGHDSFTGFMNNISDEEARVISDMLDKLRG